MARTKQVHRNISKVHQTSQLRPTGPKRVRIATNLTVEVGKASFNSEKDSTDESSAPPSLNFQNIDPFEDVSSTESYGRNNDSSQEPNVGTSNCSPPSIDTSAATNRERISLKRKIAMMEEENAISEQKTTTNANTKDISPPISSETISEKSSVSFKEPNPNTLYDMNGIPSPPAEFSRSPHTEESALTHQWCLRIHKLKIQNRSEYLRLKKLKGVYVSYHRAFRSDNNEREDRYYFIPVEKLTEEQFYILDLLHNAELGQTLKHAPSEVCDAVENLELFVNGEWSEYGVELDVRNKFMDRPVVLQFYFLSDMRNTQ